MEGASGRAGRIKKGEGSADDGQRVRAAEEAAAIGKVGESSASRRWRSLSGCFERKGKGVWEEVAFCDATIFLVVYHTVRSLNVSSFRKSGF